MLRSAVAEGTDFGRKAAEIMGRGDLVPDDVIVGLVGERLGKEDAQSGGFLLDGFPRTVAQAEARDTILVPLSMHAVVNLDVPLDEVRQRLVSRGRDDDTPEAIDRRLDLSESQTAPLFEFYESKGLLVVVDGLGSVDEVFGRLVSAIDAARGAEGGSPS